MSGRASYAWALLAVFVACACSTEVKVPEDALIGCGTAADCPSGRVCHQGLCARPDALDLVPPDLTSTAVAPGVGRAGTAFTIDLEVSEPLGEPPRVRLGLVPPVEIVCSGAGGNGYRCAYTATGQESGGQGGVVGFDVWLEDRARNETTRKLAGALSMDFAAPALAVQSVSFLPDASNPLPLSLIARARADTLVYVAVSADELLDPAVAPTLSAALGGSTLTCTLDPGTRTLTGAAFTCLVPPGAPDGDYLATVTWADPAGNEVSLDLVDAPIRVKTSIPTLLVDQAAIVFVRSPWGNAAPEDLGGYAIPAGAYFALEPADPLSSADGLPAGTFLLDGSAVPERIQVRAGSMLVGTLQPGPGGTWPRQALASPDTFTVEVVGLDDAGNGSDPRAIQHVEWVATSNLPPTGVTPHTLLRTPLVEPTRVQRTEVGSVSDDDVAGADGVATVVLAEEVWRKTAVAPTWHTSERAALAYDGARGRVVMFGGLLSSSVLQEVRELVGNAWVDVTPPGAKPAARYAASLAYDGARGRVVLFGGQRNDGATRAYFQDTWEWDGTSWEEKTPSSNPPARSDAAVAYDSARQRLVLFGGTGSAGELRDTWEWDGTSWTEAAVAGASPGARSGQFLAYDHARGVSVLFGGSADGVVWEWNGQSWSAVTPAGSAPRVVAGVYVHDGTRGRIVAFQHWYDGTRYQDGVWEWDGTSWSQAPVTGAFPQLSGWAAAHDAARARTILVQGGHGQDWGATWAWDGASFTNVTPSGVAPPARYMYQNSLAYDAARRRMVLFGGSSVADTWEWNGSSWWKVTPAGSSPPAWNTGLAYDASSQRTMLVTDTQTWAWDGTAWTSTTPATYQASGTLAYADALVVLGFSGAWRWTGLDWTSMPRPGASGVAAFDSVRGRLVLYAPNDETSTALWEWNGASWTNVVPVGARPPLRGSTAMAFDSERGRTIMFGGMDIARSGVLQDAWEWDGTSWRDATPSGIKPPARRFLSLAYDSDRRRTVLFSGNDVGGDVYWDDTWELEARPGTRPAVQFDASMSRSGITPGQVTGMHVRAHGGGTFTRADAGSAGTSGATLMGWSTHSPATGPGGWIPLATNDAGLAGAPPVLAPPSATLIDWAAASAEEARRFLTERDGQLSFQVRPSGSMGPDPGGAKVALDYIEVRVRYRSE